MKFLPYISLACTLLLPASLLPLRALGQEPVAPTAATSPPATPSLLTSGPVHEALVPAYTMAVESEMRVPRQPPTEQPALERPAKRYSDAVWIDGYWDWHQPRGEFIWIPGIYRKLPPGLSWQPGTWVPAPDGAVRYAGFFFATNARPSVIRSAPPSNPEFDRDRGRLATRKMIGDNAFWVRGSWQLDAQGNYGWQAGYVTANQPGYQWQPGRVVPASGGYAVLPGYWDYPPALRGQAFAALRQPIAPQTMLAPIDMQSIVRAPNGTWIYTRLQEGNTPDLIETVAVVAQPDVAPRRLERGLLIDGSGTIMGLVRKGKLTPQYITVKLMGGAALVTETDEQGRFLFKDVPYGNYTLFAEGPVQNYHRQGAAFVDVEQPTVEVEIELE